MKTQCLLCGIAGVLLFAFASWGQEKKIQRVPAKPTTDISGDALYKEYCATCHGMNGKGGGPAAAALKVPVPDLTKVSARNGGQFPKIKVMRVIRGQDVVAAHGSTEMPVWGPIFRSMTTSEGQTSLRVANLADFVEKLQTK
jgi:mono/diheme cytochrome c family protein